MGSAKAPHYAITRAAFSCHLGLMPRHWDSHSHGGEMDLPQKIPKTNHQRQCGSCEDHAHEPFQLNSQQDF